MDTSPYESIRLNKLLRVPRERVYEAWLDPEQRRQWWGSSDEMTCTSCEIDAKAGGAYRINMCRQDNEYVCHGEFIELDPPRKIVFSWNWEHTPEFGGDSRVTIELFETTCDDMPATELVLTHDRLKSALERGEHSSGWFGCLKSLGTFFHGKPSEQETQEVQ